MQSSVYTNYVPFSEGKSHDGELQETVTLNYAVVPTINYKLQFDALKNCLSAAQLDCVLLALQCHELFLPSGERKGFYIGDGAGVGKGRQLAAIIAENFRLGRKKAIWFTCSEALKSSCLRDLRDVDKDESLGMKLFILAGYDQVLPTEGILFCQYTTLTSKSPKTNISRLEVLNNWLGENFDGVIILDECHRAKNCASSTGKTSKISVAVVKLQQSNKMARVVYSSATGLSEVGHLGYMQRLGLYGKGCAFENAYQFSSVMERSGVSCMELLGVELKSNGTFLSRVLCMDKIQFETIKCEMSDKKLYNNSALLWLKMLKYLGLRNIDQKEKYPLYSHFWGGHLRFNTLMILSCKISQTVQITKEALKQGCAVVIGLQNTGESQQPGGEDENINCFSSARIVTQDIALRCCDIELETEEEQPPSAYDIGTYDEEEDFEQNWDFEVNSLECLEKEIKSLFSELYNKFPPNPLDELKHKLGGEGSVAELTGRTKCWVLEENGKYVEKLRPSHNNEEIVNFQSGKKNIAIVTDACSVGISLHDEVESGQPLLYQPKYRKRVHVTIQSPWSAEKMVQQLGRTHRSMAMSLPKYIYLVSDISGESRFISSISQRIKKMGALTQGDRNAGFSGYFLNEIHGNYGKKSIRMACEKIAEEADDVMYACHKSLEMVGIMDGGSLKEGKDKTKIFLNRIMGCPHFVQKAVLQLVEESLEEIINVDKKSHKYDDGIKSFVFGLATRAKIINEELIKIRDDANVSIKTVEVDRSLKWSNVTFLLKTNENCLPKRDVQFFKKKNALPSKAHVILSFRRENGDYIVYQPTNCVQNIWDDEDMFEYMRCDQETAETNWEEECDYMCQQRVCIDTYESGEPCIKDHCQNGKAIYNIHVLCGAVISVWPTVTKLLGLKGKESFGATKVLLSDGTKFVGILVEQKLLQRLKDGLNNLGEASFDCDGNEDESPGPSKKKKMCY